MNCIFIDITLKSMHRLWVLDYGRDHCPIPIMATVQCKHETDRATLQNFLKLNLYWSHYLHKAVQNVPLEYNMNNCILTQKCHIISKRPRGTQYNVQKSQNRNLFLKWQCEELHGPGPQ